MATLFRPAPIPPMLDGPVITWVTGPTVLRPQFDVSGVIFDEDQVWTLERSTNDFATIQSASHTIVDAYDALAFNFSGDWSDATTYKVRCKYTDGAQVSHYSNELTVGLNSAETTAPILSSAVDSANGTTAGTGSVTTDENNGTIYWVVSTSASAPSTAQVKAGQMHTGSAAADSGSSPVDSGVGTYDFIFSGLSPATTYYAHYMHEDDAGNQSNVVSGNGLTTTGQATVEVLGSSGVLNRAFSGAAYTFDLTSDIVNGDDLAVLITWYQDQGGLNDFVIQIEGVSIPAISAFAAGAGNSHHGCLHRLENWAGGTVTTATVTVDPNATPDLINVTVIRLTNAASGLYDTARVAVTFDPVMSTAIDIPVGGLGIMWGSRSFIGSVPSNTAAKADNTIIDNQTISVGDGRGVRVLATSCLVSGTDKIVGVEDYAGYPGVWLAAFSVAVG